MTLVVANLLDKEISILSDTAISVEPSNNYHERYSPLMAGALKTIIVTPTICISFAGIADYALDSIRSLKAKGDTFGIENTIDFLLHEHLKRSVDSRPDFIIAGLSEYSPSLMRISDGNVERNLTTCWIGSSQAFSHYQSLYHQFRETASNPTDTTPLQRLRTAMLNAMKKLIDDDVDDTVGGFAIPTWSSSNNFHHAYHFEVTGVKRNQTATTEWTIIEFADADEGGYGYSILRPLQSGISAIGIYIYQIRTGIFLYPLQLNNGIKVKGVTTKQFIEYIESKFHVSLISGLLSAN